MELLEKVFYFLVLLAIIILPTAFVIQKMAKRGLKWVEKKEADMSRNNNVFIRAHKQYQKEGPMYDEYLKWMHENNVEEVPFDKPQRAEDLQASKKIKRLIN